MASISSTADGLILSSYRATPPQIPGRFVERSIGYCRRSSSAGRSSASSARLRRTASSDEIGEGPFRLLRLDPQGIVHLRVEFDRRSVRRGHEAIVAPDRTKPTVAILTAQRSVTLRRRQEALLYENVPQFLVTIHCGDHVTNSPGSKLSTSVSMPITCSIRKLSTCGASSLS